MSGKLWIVSIPIGDMRDITLRAIEVLKECDVILCEDLKPAGRFFHELRGTLIKSEYPRVVGGDPATHLGAAVGAHHANGLNQSFPKSFFIQESRHTCVSIINRQKRYLQ